MCTHVSGAGLGSAAAAAAVGLALTGAVRGSFPGERRPGPGTAQRSSPALRTARVALILAVHAPYCRHSRGADAATAFAFVVPQVGAGMDLVMVFLLCYSLLAVASLTVWTADQRLCDAATAGGSAQRPTGESTTVRWRPQRVARAAPEASGVRGWREGCPACVWRRFMRCQRGRRSEGPEAGGAPVLLRPQVSG